MAKLKTFNELETLSKAIVAKRDPDKTVITICNGTGCHAHGCKAVTSAFEEEVKKQKLAGTIAFRGAMEYQSGSDIQMATILRLSENMPGVIEIVDFEQNIQSFLLYLQEVITNY